MKIIGIVCGAVVFLIAIAFGITYSWTFTPQGRLDYRAAVLAKLSYWNLSPMQMDASSRRMANEATAKITGVAMPHGGFTQRDVQVTAEWGNIPVRIYIPDGAGPFPSMVNFHGGAFWTGDGFAYDAIVVELAIRAKVVVFSVDYRLAPEYPFPAGFDDCYRALQWVVENAAQYRADPTRLGVMGQSAGGNLAAAVALKARDTGGPKIAFQYLDVPALDLSEQREWPSAREAGERYGLKVSYMPAINAAYLKTPADRSNPYASPLLAPDHHNLPPAFIVAAQFDPLRDQAAAYAEALKKAGVPVQLEIVPGVLHAFMGTPKRALKNLGPVAAAVQQALSSPSP